MVKVSLSLRNLTTFCAPCAAPGAVPGAAKGVQSGIGLIGLLKFYF